MRFLTTWVLIPILHFLIVAVVLWVLAWVLERLRIALEVLERSNAQAMHLPVNAKMAECSYVITRANGDVEPEVVNRTYRNPLRRMAWALQSAFTKGR